MDILRPSRPGKVATSSAITTSGRTKNSRPYRWLKRCAISRAISRCWTWSRPTGTWLALNSRMSAAIRTGYENSPMVTPSSGSTPLAAFWSTDAL
ncbi:Uncharacterised protein [Bordetella pertussis]|nr:Uncharacterised protein [Bordetella pertussis]CFP65872.1 Uncharacterised protein [Bordetella pertussis]